MTLLEHIAVVVAALYVVYNRWSLIHWESQQFLAAQERALLENRIPIQYSRLLPPQVARTVCKNTFNIFASLTQCAFASRRSNSC